MSFIHLVIRIVLFKRFVSSFQLPIISLETFIGEKCVSSIGCLLGHLLASSDNDFRAKNILKYFSVSTFFANKNVGRYYLAGMTQNIWSYLCFH
jgi:hypothetical protein